MTRVWITRARNADGTEAAALYDLYLDGEPAAHGKTLKEIADIIEDRDKEVET